MDNEKQVNPALVAGGGVALLAGLVLRKKRKAKKAAKREARAEAAVLKPEKKRKAKKAAKREAREEKALQEQEKKAKKGKKGKRLAVPDVEMVEKGTPQASDHLLRDIVLLTGAYKLKSKKKRTKPLALVVLLYLVEQIYREWEQKDEPVPANGSEPQKKGKHKK